MWMRCPTWQPLYDLQREATGFRTVELDRTAIWTMFRLGAARRGESIWQHAFDDKIERWPTIPNIGP
jgi:hypothetical protein